MPRIASVLVLLLASCGSAPPRVASSTPSPSPSFDVPTRSPAVDRSQPSRLVAFRAEYSSGFGDVGGFAYASADGTVRCWGPTCHPSLEASELEQLHGAVELAATPSEICGRMPDGDVACISGVDGTGRVELDAVDLAAQRHELCALTREGRVLCWGRSSSLVTSSDDSLDASEGAPIADAIALRAVPPMHDGAAWCVLRRSGIVSCWGLHGLPGVELSRTAEDVPGLVDVVDLVLGDRPCVLRRSGGVMCVARDEEQVSFEVVVPTEARPRSTPEGWTAMPGTEAVVELAWKDPAEVGRCGRTATGERICWQEPERLLAGDVERSRAEVLALIEDEELRAYYEAIYAEDAERDEDDPTYYMPAEIAAELDEVHEDERGGCASLRTGGVRCWGEVPDGLGRRDVVARPRRVEGVPRAVSLDHESGTTCVVDEAGLVHCWGDHPDRRYDDAPGPRRLSGMRRVTEVRGDGSWLFASTSNGAVVRRERIGWGESARSTDRTLRFLAGVEQLTAGFGTACGIRDGRVRCVVRDTDYVEGPDGRSEERVSEHEITVEGLEDVVELHGQPSAMVARTRENRVAWITVLDREVNLDWHPEPLPGLLVADGRTVCALEEDRFTCVRRGGSEPSTTVRVPSGLVRVSMSADDLDGDRACGARQDGRLVCWGYNAAGQLGDPRIGRELEPFVVEGIEDVRDVDVADGSTCALTRGGDVYCWGAAGDALGFEHRPELAPVRSVPEVR